MLVMEVEFMMTQGSDVFLSSWYELRLIVELSGTCASLICVCITICLGSFISNPH